MQNAYRQDSQTVITESISTSAVFQLTDRLPIFSYLVSSNRIRWYRVIMRYFFHCHRELYRYQLTAQEVRDTVRATLEAEYTLEQCQNDLAALKEWGNITTIYDSSRATSIASFLAPALLYQATPEAIAIETFLDEQTRASTGKGALRQGDLSHLWQSLQSLDDDLRTPPEEYSPEHGREMAEEWQRVFEIWNTMAREAAQYLANMIKAAQQGRPDFDTFQAYKAAVVAYVHGFAQSLTLYSRRIRTLLAEWVETDKKDRLIAIVAQHLEPPSPTLENRSSEAELLQEAENQLNALLNWFALGKNADSFRRNALAEVDKVVRRASVLAASARPNANYATNLHALALQLFQARDGETAQQLFSLAFANLLPVHLPESLAGRASARFDVSDGNAWQQPPALNLRLRPVSRSFRGEHTLEDPVIDNSIAVRDIIQQYEERLQQERLRFANLFSSGSVDLGALKQISVAQREILLTVIDGCLGDTRRQYRAPDGSTITLLNHEEQTYTVLRASDGLLLLPRYRLLRDNRQERQA
ncbi:MAG TPA: TIGR02677 family protein [Ktedonobacteraceae bacterium]|nr:TIGR02677 family protein [Ktedonobacteraceae bacterium]